MANITLTGTLLDPNSDLAVGDEIRFTHASTTGQTIKGAISLVTIGPAGTYSVPLQYGLVLVEYKDIRSTQFKNLGVATVNASNTATSIPELLNALVPVSSAELIEFQAILADAVTAKNASEAAAATTATRKDTFANLILLSPTTDGITFVCQERASAEYILQAAGYTALAGDATFANGRVAALQVSDVSLANFGTDSDWDAAIDLQIERMQLEGLAIIIKSDRYVLTSQHVLDGTVKVVCLGNVRFVTTEFSGSLFKFQIEVTRNGTTGWQGGNFVFNYAGSNAGSAAVELSGLSTAFLQYCDFDVGITQGCESGILNTHLPRTTSFGLENNVAWCNFIIRSTTSKYPINFTLGSGTGNTWLNSKFGIDGNGGAAMRFAGTGCVVGDILVSGSHALATVQVDGAFIEIADNTVYRSNICFSACQVDANVVTPFKFSQVGTATYNNIKWFGSLGGGTELNAALGVLEGSIILDKGVSDFRVSKIFPALPSGSQTIKVCDVVVQNNSACKVEVNISGLIEGVAVTMHTSIFHVRTQASTSTVFLLSQENSPFVAVTISSSVAGNITSIFASITPTTTGSRLNAQISAVGGIFQLIRP
jgi:hypothetical protein